ncbi:hypothetical protein C8J57DRAFT_1556885 [Mycena rebaudengoi]|nr:hypothetical protein C8J57DRAFT_1556885 [Mycena rebaudengoi]
MSARRVANCWRSAPRLRCAQRAGGYIFDAASGRSGDETGGGKGGGEIRKEKGWRAGKRRDRQRNGLGMGETPYTREDRRIVSRQWKWKDKKKRTMDAPYHELRSVLQATLPSHRLCHPFHQHLLHVSHTHGIIIRKSLSAPPVRLRRAVGMPSGAHTTHATRGQRLGAVGGAWEREGKGWEGDEDDGRLEGKMRRSGERVQLET